MLRGTGLLGGMAKDRLVQPHGLAGDPSRRSLAMLNAVTLHAAMPARRSTALRFGMPPNLMPQMMATPGGAACVTLSAD